MSDVIPGIPVCWPIDGRCGCGRGHSEKEVGKAPLISITSYVLTPPSPAQLAAWATRWPCCNWATLLEPSGWLVLDLDTLDALGEATALGMPPAPCWTTARGRNYVYLAPPEVRGRRTTKRGESKAIDVLAGGYAVVPPSRHRLGVDYRWVVPPTIVAPGPAPRWAVEMLLEAVEPGDTGPVALPDHLPVVDTGRLAVPARIRALLAEGTAAEYASRSEAVFAVVRALVIAGHDDAAIAAVLTDSRNGISAKPLECGRRWVAHEIARAQRKSR